MENGKIDFIIKQSCPDSPVDITVNDIGSVFFLIPKEYWLAKILFSQKILFEVRIKSFSGEDVADIEFVNKYLFGKYFKHVYSLNVKTGETDLINEEDGSVFIFSDKQNAIKFMSKKVIHSSSANIPCDISKRNDETISQHIKTINEENVAYTAITESHVGKTIYGVPQNVPLSRKVNGMTIFSKTAHEAIKEYGLMIMKPLKVVSFDPSTLIATLSLHHQGKDVTFDVNTTTGRSTGFKPLRDAEFNFSSFFYFDDSEHFIKYSQREELLDIAEPYFKNRLVCRSMTNDDIVNFLKIFDKII